MRPASPDRSSETALEDYIQENMKVYQSILTQPCETYRSAFSDYKSLYVERYHYKRVHNQVKREVGNLKAVN